MVDVLTTYTIADKYESITDEIFITSDLSQFIATSATTEKGVEIRTDSYIYDGKSWRYFAGSVDLTGVVPPKGKKNDMGFIVKTKEISDKKLKIVISVSKPISVSYSINKVA